MHPNAALITRFYEAFAARDGAAMAACYHPEVHFSDPVFPDLHGADAGLMWRMLTERGKDLVIRFDEVQADDQQGSAHWQADYTFSATKRFVKNDIRASFTFKDGLILRHQDSFGFYAWARQALGPMGLLLGWTPMLHKKVQSQAAAGLAAFKPRN